MLPQMVLALIASLTLSPMGSTLPAMSYDRHEPKEFKLALKEIQCGHCSAAHDHFLHLAQQGHAKSQTVLALMYQEGAGVKKDARQAAMWFEKAANQGVSEAEAGLGHLYAFGDQSVRDPQLAEAWLTKGAEHGVMEAQRDLGKVLLLKGDLAGKDHARAVHWLKRAAGQGSEEAQRLLDQIPGADKAENAIAQGRSELQQGGNSYGQGLNDLTMSWKGYADIVKSVSDAANAASTN
jgi:TPR repeat protein